MLIQGLRGHPQVWGRDRAWMHSFLHFTEKPWGSNWMFLLQIVFVAIACIRFKKVAKLTKSPQSESD
jgi:hypothetical protein